MGDIRFKHILAMVCIGVLAGCTSSPQEQNTAQQEAYQFNQPETFLLPQSLLEISGIAFYNGNPNTIYAIQDEDGDVFQLAWNDSKMFQTKFKANGDFEDISIMKDQIFILESDGSIYQFPLSESKNTETTLTKVVKLLPKGEYESLYGDEQTGKLFVLCKKCDQDDKENSTGYILNTSNGIKMEGSFTLNLSKMTGKKIKKGLRPSALAQNPLTKEWYVLSSVNKLMVITNPDWQIQRTVELDKSLYNQPEGIAFDADGNLYISNEGNGSEPGNIYRFALN